MGEPLLFLMRPMERDSNRIKYKNRIAQLESGDPVERLATRLAVSWSGKVASPKVDDDWVDETAEILLVWHAELSDFFPGPV